MKITEYLNTCSKFWAGVNMIVLEYAQLMEFVASDKDEIRKQIDEVRTILLMAESSSLTDCRLIIIRKDDSGKQVLNSIPITTIANLRLLLRNLLMRKLVVVSDKNNILIEMTTGTVGIQTIRAHFVRRYSNDKSMDEFVKFANTLVDQCSIIGNTYTGEK